MEATVGDYIIKGVHLSESLTLHVLIVKRSKNGALFGLIRTILSIRIGQRVDNKPIALHSKMIRNRLFGVNCWIAPLLQEPPLKMRQHMNHWILLLWRQ